MFNKIIKVLAFVEVVGLIWCAIMVVRYVDGLKGLLSIPLILFTLPYFYIMTKEDEEDEEK